ncbi:hypothetical protein [Tsukamurella strandjordii]|uniref:Uncharacterized protein n=1 Tax=Tsukamurella strandjordii TaxID=147577 RepID=A0AA90NAY6_9ACTN|nr:hypothetical protein [Tsukamurella strandjordii]MDP0399182.1 hypothetical protein [Tsukamurella strandjordii]
MTDNKISTPRFHPSAENTYGGVDPLAPPTFASGAQRQRERNADTAAKNADARTAQIAAETNHNITAAMAQRPTARPSLKAKPSGRVAEIWNPIRERTVGAFSRVSSRLDGAPEAGQTREALIAAALDAGARREKIADDLTDRLAAVERRDELAEASRAGVHLAGSMTAARLTALAHDHADELYEAVQADLRDLIVDSGQVARALEGVDSAEVAIRLGEAATIAWSARDGLRERMLAVAESARFVHRATTDGFTYMGTAPDTLKKAGIATEGSASTWDLVDSWLEQFGTSDVIVDLLVGR